MTQPGQQGDAQAGRAVERGSHQAAGLVGARRYSGHHPGQGLPWPGQRLGQGSQA